MGFDGFPFVIGWELTLACNLQCSHCGSSAGYPRVKELTLDESLTICDQFPDLLVQEIDFTGGEPLLRPDWLQIANRLSVLGIRTKIITNGLVITSKILSQMKLVGIAGVGVSLDGLESNHDYIRNRPGLFQRVLKVIEIVQEADIPLTVITTVNARNIDELPAMLELLSSLGVHYWQVQPLFPLGRSQKCINLHLSEKDYFKFGAFIQRWTPFALTRGVEISPGDSFGYFTPLDTREPTWRGCPAGLFSCGITSDGKIKGCLSLPDELIEGDLRTHDLWDIWFSQDSFTYTRGFCLEQLGPNCQKCDKAIQCQGGCSAMSYGYSGQFHNDPYCFYGIQTTKESSLRIYHSGTRIETSKTLNVLK